jgi:hypothetical protein
MRQTQAAKLPSYACTLQYANTNGYLRGSHFSVIRLLEDVAMLAEENVVSLIVPRAEASALELGLL